MLDELKSVRTIAAANERPWQLNIENAKRVWETGEEIVGASVGASVLEKKEKNAY